MHSFDLPTCVRGLPLTCNKHCFAQSERAAELVRSFLLEANLIRTARLTYWSFKARDLLNLAELELMVEAINKEVSYRLS